MSDAPKSSSASDSPDTGIAPDRPSWGLAWQIPVAVVAVMAIAAAVAYRQPVEEGPDPAELLSQAQAAIEGGRLGVAERMLADVEPLLDAEGGLLADYHLTVGDYRLAVVSPIQATAPGLAAQVVEAYRRAESDGATIGPVRRVSLILGLVAVGDDDVALAELEAVWPSLDEPGRVDLRPVRQRLVRAWVDRELRSPRADFSLIEARVRELEGDALDVELDAWRVAVDAQIRLRRGDLDGLARHLGLAMHRIEGRLVEDPVARVDWASLWLLLGHAYRDELGQSTQAQECYRTAVDRLEAGGLVQVDATRALADLLIEQGRHASEETARMTALDEASRRYHMLAERLPDAGVGDVFAARRGLAEIEMLTVGVHPRDVLGRLAEAEDFLAAVDPLGGLVDERAELALVVLEAAATTFEQIDVARDVGDADAAIEALGIVVDKASMAERLASNLGLRRRALEMVGRSNERLAESLLRPYLGGVDPRRFAEFSRVPVDIQLDAFGYYATAAKAMDVYESTMSSDDLDRSDFVWRAAVLHDKSGDVEEALSGYRAFVESESVDVPLWPEAMYRVAVCHHAVGDLSSAERSYRRLLEQMDGLADQVSEFTTRGRVGLARVLLDSGEARAVVEAESLLHQVVAGTADDAVGPSVPEYRGALLQLVRLLGEMERWSELGSRGDEWLRRYPEDDRWGEVAARTGIAFVRHAELLGTGVESRNDVGTPRSMVMRRGERLKSLDLADGWLARAVGSLESRPERPMDGLEQSLLRECYLHRGVAADQRGDTSAAIAFYREAEQRFAGEAVAVMALIAMSDVATRGGEVDVAAEATRRARKRLQHLHRGGGLAEDAEMVDLFRGGDPKALDRWLTVFPPGLEDEIG